MDMSLYLVCYQFSHITQRLLFPFSFCVLFEESHLSCFPLLNLDFFSLSLYRFILYHNLSFFPPFLQYIISKSLCSFVYSLFLFSFSSFLLRLCSLFNYFSLRILSVSSLLFLSTFYLDLLSAASFIFLSIFFFLFLSANRLSAGDVQAFISFLSAEVDNTKIH